ncbi:MAG TPA: endolytic transglycosylase MltG [Clostridiales bacterium]|nr:endolytic transglycosylase MltG [Clostridiales bacterium]
MIPKKITRTLLTILVFFLLISCVVVGFYFGFAYVISQNARFAKLDSLYGDSASGSGSVIDEHSPGAIEIIIPRSSSTKEIAELLQKKGIIENTFIYTILSKFNGFDGSYMAGTHFVTAKMSYDEIMFVLTQKPKSVRVTFPEGLTYTEVKARLSEAGVNFDVTILDNMVRNPQIFLDYDFVTDISIKQGRDWLLQGYLYPDTYEFDMNTDEETIIRTFLDNTNNKLLAEYYERAEKIGKSLDEIITLASIIQMECSKTEEMRSVSSVFYNRLNKEGWRLESCATVNYLLKENGKAAKLWLDEGDITTYDSPYNTYLYDGLPPGPICSPGEDAIRAALWPETSKNLYFCAVGDGTNDFSQTLDQHNAKIAKYKAEAAQGSSGG